MTASNLVLGAIAGYSAVAGVYGLVYTRNDQTQGDTSRATDLSNGIEGPTIVISGNAAPLLRLASSIGSGGVAPTFALGTADEGETIFSMQSFGTNSNSTLSLQKARGTAANPLPLLGGDIIGVIAANGHHTAGREGGAALTGAIEFRAAEDWHAGRTGTNMSVYLQRTGTVYPVDLIEVFVIEDGVHYIQGVPLAANTIGDGLVLRNRAAASPGQQQYSPMLNLGGKGWSSAAGASQSVDFGMIAGPVEGPTPTGTLSFFARIANGAWTSLAKLHSSGLFGVATGFAVNGEVGLTQNVSIAGGTTLHFKGGILTSVT